MIDDWLSYRLGDFVPFTSEVYLRLTERVNADWWPLHLVAVALGLTALALAWRGRSRVTLALLAPAWVFSGTVFHLQHYAELVWAANGFAVACLVQASLLIVFALFGCRAVPRSGWNLRAAVGTTIASVGLVAYPFIPHAAGLGWGGSEAFGVHPDPTAVVTLGFTLVVLHGWQAWLASVIPLLWVVITTLTLVALQVTWAWVPLCLAGTALVGMIVSTRAARRERPVGS